MTMKRTLNLARDSTIVVDNLGKILKGAVISLFFNVYLIIRISFKNIFKFFYF